VHKIHVKTKLILIALTFVRGGGSSSSDPTFTSKPPTECSAGVL